MNYLYLIFSIICTFGLIQSQECPVYGGRQCRDGRDGVDGRHGINGRNGKDGLNGKDGANGVDGKDGHDGKDGKDGKNGRDGLNGKDATPNNWKECTWNSQIDGNEGLIAKCDFKKCSNSSVLNVIVSSNLRIYKCYDCCKRWYVSFNGVECNKPAPIEGIVYTLKSDRSYDTMGPEIIRGHCQSITAGVVSVEFRFGNYPYYGDALAITGFNSHSRMFIEEIQPPQA